MKKAPRLHPIAPYILSEPIEERLAANTTLLIHCKQEQPLLKVEVIIELPHCTNGSLYAYLTAKMLKEGTVKRSHQDISQTLDLCGAQLNVHLSADYCSVTLFVLSKYAATATALLFEVLREARFSDERFNHVKNIAAQKLALKTAKNSYLSFTRLRASLFGPGHPYGWSLSSQDLEQVDVAALQRYYNTQFFAPRYVLLSGCVTDSYVQDVKKRFNALGPPLHRPSVGHTITSRVEHIRQSAPNALQASIVLGCVLPKASHPDSISLWIANQAVGGYFGARLLQTIREKLGYTYNISSHIVPLQQSSYWWVYTETSTHIAQDTYLEIQNQLNVLCTQCITDEELQMVRQHILGQCNAQSHDPFEVMSRTKKIRLHNLPTDYYTQLTRTAAHIHPEDIKQLICTYFSFPALTSVITGSQYSESTS